MSLYRLGRVLALGGIVDALTPAVRYVGLLRAGQFFAIVGGVLLIGRLIVGGSPGAFLVFGAITSFILAALLLFSFAMAAKLYGRVAVASVLLFLGACFGFVVLDSRPSQPAAELTERSISPPTRREPRQLTRAASLSGEEKTPRIASTIAAPQVGEPAVNEVAATALAKPLIVQAYAVNDTHIYYPEDCTARPKKAFRIPKSIALQQGYSLAPECAGK
jgi:hypothetical protein